VSDRSKRPVATAVGWTAIILFAVISALDLVMTGLD
jgi:hypothetical protein